MSWLRFPKSCPKLLAGSCFNLSLPFLRWQLLLAEFGKLSQRYCPRGRFVGRERAQFHLELGSGAISSGVAGILITPFSTRPQDEILPANQEIFPFPKDLAWTNWQLEIVPPNTRLSLIAGGILPQNEGNAYISCAPSSYSSIFQLKQLWIKWLSRRPHSKAITHPAIFLPKSLDQSRRIYVGSFISNLQENVPGEYNSNDGIFLFLGWLPSPEWVVGEQKRRFGDHWSPSVIAPDHSHIYGDNRCM